MANKDWKLRINDMIWSIENIFDQTERLDYESFCTNQQIIENINNELETIEKAVKYIPEKIITKNQAIPWKELQKIANIKKFTNITGKTYSDEDLSALWQLIKEDFPVTVNLLRRLVGKELL